MDGSSRARVLWALIESKAELPCVCNQAEYDALDPNLGDIGPGRPRYWWADFARAEHTRQYNTSRTHAVLCPFNCSAALTDAVYDGPVQPGVFGDYAAQVSCVAVQSSWSLPLLYDKFVEDANALQ